MALSNELINAFVKATNDKTDIKQETTVYGTVAISDGVRYVKLDGSTEITPVSSLVTIAHGDRVRVSIKNHRAVVTGNLSSVSASSTEVMSISTELAEVETVNASKVNTTDLDAVVARVEILETNSATIKSLEAAEALIYELEANEVVINETLEAQEASIKLLEAEKLDAEFANATYATIEDLEATDATIYNLEATYGDFEVLTTNKFTAVDAYIDDLYATKLAAETAAITYATITDLDAANADITVLESEVANIDTLIFGSASGTTIQTTFSNAVIAQLGDAQIKSAMIESISASKITSGDIITNYVQVKSEDGSLVISDETMQISDDTRVRVQIGKDSSGDYSINIWDEDGNLMFSKGGITDSAIKDAIIRNDMVSDSANIAAHKLDIDSLFEEINGSTNTINATQVYLDDQAQTLEVAFRSLTTDISSLDTIVSSQGTQLSVVQGQIDSKIWETDISTAIDEIEVGGRNLVRDSTLSEITSMWTYSAGDTDVVSTANGYLEFSRSHSDSYTSRSFIIQPSGKNRLLYPDVISGETFTLSADLKKMDDVGLSASTSLMYRVYDADGGYQEITLTIPSDLSTEWRRCSATFTFGEREWSSAMTGVGLGNADNGICIRNIKVEKGNVATDWTPAPEDQNADITTLTTKYSSLEQTVNGISSTVASHTTQISNKADSSTVTSVSNQVTSLEQTLTGFQTSVSEDYATKTEVSDAVDNVEVGGRNLVRNSAFLQGDSNWTLYSTASVDDTMPRGNHPSLKVENAGYTSSKWYGAKNYKLPISNSALQSGDTYTISCWYYVEDASTFDSDIGYEIKGTNSSGSETTCFRRGIEAADIVEGEWTNISITSTLSDTFTNCYLFVWVRQNGVAWFTDFKMEKGNKPTDWTPAPEDTEEELETVNVRQTTLEQTVDGISATVSNHTTQISNKADSSTVTTIQTNLSALELTVSGFQTSVSETYVTKTEYNDLEIGGRNLALGTSNEYKEASLAQYYQVLYSVDIATLVDAYSLSNGDTLTASVYFKSGSSKDLVLRVQHYNTSADRPNVYGNTIAAGGEGRSEATFTLDTSYPKLQILVGNNSNTTISDTTIEYYKCLKIERGTKATDWSPAPEDVDENIDAVQTNVDNLEIRVTQNESSISQNASSITAAVSRIGVNENAIANLEIEADNITSRVSTNEVNINAALTNAANAQASADTAQASVDGLEIGGVNLLSNTSDEYVQINVGQWYNLILESNSTNYNPIDNYGLSVGDTITFALDIYGGDYGGCARITTFSDASGSNKYAIAGDLIAAGEYGRSYLTLTLTDTMLYMGLGIQNGDTTQATNYVKYKCAKLERGNKPTDWSRAMADLATADELSSAQTSITQNATSISSIATRTTNNESSITTLTQTAKELTASVADAAKTATNYLNFSSSGLVVGDHTGSSLGNNVLIDSDSVDIRNGDTVLASFQADTIELGKHSKDATIDLCNETGVIRADTYDPVTNSSYSAEGLFVESNDRIVIDSPIARINSDNRGDSEDGYNQAYMSNWVTENSAYVNLEAVNQDGTTSASYYGRFEARSHDLVNVLGMDAADNEPYALLEARNASYLNRFYVYPTFSRITQKLLTTSGIRSKGDIIIGTDAYGAGGRALGVNKVLWSGAYYMTETHSITLSESVLIQPTGIVLTFSKYADGAALENNYNHFFVPKGFISAKAGYGNAFTMMDINFGQICHKYLYINATTISGHANNDASGTGDSGITYANNKYVLRYVFGV